MTLRETLEGLLGRARRPERRAELEAELAVPPYPEPLAYLWLAFNRMRRRKGSNGFGIVPLDWADFDGFARLTGFAFAPWEIAILEDLDDLFLASNYDKPRT